MARTPRAAGGVVVATTRRPAAHRPKSSGSHSQTSAVTPLARRLGVSQGSLLAYLEAHGGAPDGVDRSRDRVAELVDRRCVTHALPARADGRATAPPRWVKRDRPRYFIPD